ncbi:nucleotidyl transferase AbiEii/AbiGii toxin family protein [Tepidicaulis sp.]|uniref:nucleotidyl transferase AbiEii/AbiGii toxin family protein n=1 Tax=Tepidicaulis sp. TaxID=1920809 RepID=UPI003B5B2205
MTKIIKNHAASIRAKLFNHAKQHGDDFQRILTRYAIERLLFRLSQTQAAEFYVLKGAMLFITWPEHIFRPTGDLDLLGKGPANPDAITKLVTEICTIECHEDGIQFLSDSLRVDEVREADKYQGVRVNLNAELHKAIIQIQIDIGFGDHVHPTPKRGSFPNLLSGLPEANILMYPAESVIAEKLQALIHLGELNSRIKDFYDIWVLARTFPFEMSDIVEAINGTLQRRETVVPTEIPLGLTKAFVATVNEQGLWTGFLRRNPPTIMPPPFAELQEELRRFFGPIITALDRPEAAYGLWDPKGGVWQ